MPYYEYKGKINKIEYPLISEGYNFNVLNNTTSNNVNQFINNFFIIYFKIAKGDVQHRGKFAYLPCLTYDGYPSKSRMHIHVMCQNGEAKFWLSPKIELANNYELSKTQIKEIKNIIEENYDKFKDAWKNHKED